MRDFSGSVPLDDMPPPNFASASAFRDGTAWNEAEQEERAAALRAAFVQGGPADTLAPGALLAALTEAAFADAARLSDDELTGALEAARRLRNRAHYLETLAIADLARRRAEQYEKGKVSDVPRNLRRAQFPDLELAAQLLIGRRHAAHLLDEAAELTARLPLTLAGMADGLIDAARASAIAAATLCLSDADAARADQALAATAHEYRAETVARRAAALAMKLDPEAARREREDAQRTRQRTETRREDSGNASFAVREADTSVVLSVKAAIDELALRLRSGGATGTLDSLRAMAALDRLLGCDPLDRLAPLPPEPAGEDDGGQDGDGNARYRPGPCAAPENPSGPCAVTEAQEQGTGGSRVKFPVLINLLVPAATLLGWGSAPGQADAWGLTDPQETRDIVQAASCHPRTRWCLTIVNERGEAVAHACASGQHPWASDPLVPLVRPDPSDPPPGTPVISGTSGAPDAAEQSARIREFLATLGIVPGGVEQVARGTCDHRHAELGYVPSRKLKHLIRARSQSCTAPGCGGQSVHADLDHIVSYPEVPSDECNLHTPCRAHHRAKQSPGWRVEMPEPGVLRRTLPSGRVRISRPTRYDC